jgi:MATE family multidrug resistance protein
MITRLFGLSWKVELSQLLALAVPLAVSQVGLIAMNVTDSIMMGRISAESLAAGGLAGTVAFSLLIFTQGMLMALQPILAQSRGAADLTAVPRVLAASFAMALICSVPIIGLLLFVDKFLVLSGTELPLAKMALDYEKGLVWAVPAALWQMTCRYYLSALERPRIILIATLTACLANVFFNWVLIYGHLGMPAFGLRGSAYATALSCWGMAIAMTVYAARCKLLPEGLLRVSLGELGKGMAELFRIGWPIACTIIAEMGLFSVSTILMGRFGPVPLAAHQICLGISSLTFMVPMAIGQASTVRVGFHIGAGQPHLARQAGFLSLVLGVGFMALSATALKLFSGPVIRLYLDADDPEIEAVLAVGRQMIALAAVFQLFDGAQTVASGALRGLKDTHAAMIFATAGYWGLGLPLGVLLAFFLGFGPLGLWWGFVAGLAMVAVLLTTRFAGKSSKLVAAATVKSPSGTIKA